MDANDGSFRKQILRICVIRFSDIVDFHTYYAQVSRMSMKSPIFALSYANWCFPHNWMETKSVIFFGLLVSCLFISIIQNALHHTAMQNRYVSGRKEERSLFSLDKSNRLWNRSTCHCKHAPVYIYYLIIDFTWTEWMLLRPQFWLLLCSRVPYTSYRHFPRVQ